MTRRELLAAAAACAPQLWARTHLDKSHISAITDEIGHSTDESIAFAHQYGLQWVEIRNPPGERKEYFQLEEAAIKLDAVRFSREGLKVSFINTSLLKFTWPGMEAARKRTEDEAARAKRLAAEKARWDGRMDDLHKAIRCAQIMGCDKVRVFTGSRIAEPASAFSRIAETITEMAAVAEREKVYLLVENEGSQNVATSAEMADLLKLIPARWVGFNWDPGNAYGKEVSFPDGFNLLPRQRMMNAQIKARGIMPNGDQKEDWKGILTALDKEGYKYRVGLETHIFDGTLVAAAHTSMDEIMHIVNQF